MKEQYLIPALVFMLKYFFDIEKEITHQLLFNVHMQLTGYKKRWFRVEEILK